MKINNKNTNQSNQEEQKNLTENIYLDNHPRVLFEEISDEVYEKVLREGEDDEFINEMVDGFFSDPQVEK